MNPFMFAIATGIVAAIIYDILKPKYLIRIGKLFLKALASIEIKAGFQSSDNYKEKVILREILNKQLFEITDGMTIRDAVEYMTKNKFWRAPVESNAHEYLGLIFLDKLKNAIRNGRGSSRVTSEMLPREKTIYFHLADTCGEAFKTLRKNKLSHAPVAFNHRVVGFISLIDLEKYIKE